MRQIQAFQCADGAVHINYDTAKAHETDLLCENLENLLKMFGFNGDQVTRSEEIKAIWQLAKREDELRAAIVSILQILNHGGDED
jgi:hypothetical protein